MKPTAAFRSPRCFDNYGSSGSAGLFVGRIRAALCAIGVATMTDSLFGYPIKMVDTPAQTEPVVFGPLLEKCEIRVIIPMSEEAINDKNIIAHCNQEAQYSMYKVVKDELGDRKIMSHTIEVFKVHCYQEWDKATEDYVWIYERECFRGPANCLWYSIRVELR